MASKVIIPVRAREIENNATCTVNLKITVHNNRQCIEIEGSDVYEVDSIIKGWRYSHNLGGLSTTKVHVGFTELLDAIVRLRLPQSCYNTVWYKQIELLLNTSQE